MSTIDPKRDAGQVRVMSLDEAFEFLKVQGTKNAKFERVAMAVFSPEDNTNLMSIVVSEQAR